jgi:hypothetical protein
MLQLLFNMGKGKCAVLIINFLYFLYNYYLYSKLRKKNSKIYIFNNKVNQQIHYHQNDVSLLKYLLKKAGYSDR